MEILSCYYELITIATVEEGRALQTPSSTSTCFFLVMFFFLFSFAFKIVVINMLKFFHFPPMCLYF